MNLDVLEVLRINFGTYTSDVHHVEDYLARRHEIENRGVEPDTLHQQLSSLLAPTRRLPLELLLIFAFCYENSDIGSLTITNSPPIRLSHVYAGWRKLSRTTPALSSSFCIYDYPIHDQGIRLDWFQHELSRLKQMVDLHL
ncbi:hypothetical protein D9758_014326 [Tetrapyrgos nigripes]|uniref:F-box domain-containing protein n=1 Tax=Tetrapyrgos nigripes TaxID=182062 RepID=A0A8H5CB13_9AGAR|nr:hypothetical protein D9758_014326 [Tetrapyrgos nigripes]